jgi:hypothetical protein
MPAANPWWSGKIAIDIEEACARDVSCQVELTAAVGIPELPATVDELVAHQFRG